MPQFTYTQNGFIDVCASGAKEGEDCSGFFPENANGYHIDGSVISVDADTLRRLTKAKVTGDGAVRWIGFKPLVHSSGSTPFDGVIPVKKLSDPVYLSMNMPSEATTYMRSRINPSNLFPPSDKYGKVISIGALYRSEDSPLPDSAEFTVCLGRIQIIMKTKDSDGWFIANDLPYPKAPKNIFYLPWSLEHTLGAMKLSDDRITYFDDRVEIKLTGAELNGANGRDKGAEGSVLHFWGENVIFDNGADILGVVIAYRVWIKEKEYENRVVAAIGADWRTPEGGRPDQAFSGYNWLLKTQPRTIIGHTVGNADYDRIVDTQQIQRLIGI